ncbi:MAG TPA: S8 family serine peptidase [Rhizobiaceae bacterium]|nr:S8 family serine peptidase [Rhizobiaceae bacterium]
MYEVVIASLGFFARRLVVAALIVSVAPVADRLGGLDLALHVAQAGDDDGGDDDGDDGGGGGRGGFSDRSGDDVRRSGRSLGPGFLRTLRDRFRPRGSGRRAVAAAPLPTRVANEIVAIGLTDENTRALEAAGFTVEDRQALSIGGSIALIRTPDGSNLDEAIVAFRTAAPGANADFNHYYRPNQDAVECSGNHCVAPQLVGWPNAAPDAASCSGEGLTLGLIDTAINPDHATFSHGRLEVVRLSDDALPESNRQHGTAVAALLVGAADSKTPGLLPNARLIAVDAFHRGERRDDRAEAFDLIRALDHLASRDVDVINLSLAGPENALLKDMVRQLSEKGIVLVAAAGNNGPRAAPSYPAAYDEVIAVTAVDRRKRSYRRAGQGDHIDIAAPGVDVWTAASVSGARPKTGTSFAAPFVASAAALARQNAVPDVAVHLTNAAEDLGEPGKDPVFGWGLLNARGLCGS